MATPKPQIRSAFATPICVHFLPVATEVNAELRPLIIERMQASGTPEGIGWRSEPDFESWGGLGAQTLFRMLRELADSMTATRAGGRVSFPWIAAACADVRHKGEAYESGRRAGAFWAGVYFVDDGYAKSDDESLGGECELLDPRGYLPGYMPPHLGFRIPGGTTAGMSEIIRPQSGMIVMHPGWMTRGERRFEGAGQRVSIEFELALP
jgi:hypothetical protein